MGCNQAKFLSSAVVAYLISLFFESWYVSGDYSYYREIYHNLKLLSYQSGFDYYSSKVLSINKMPAFTMFWIFSKSGLSFLFFNAAANFMILALLFSLVKDQRSLSVVAIWTLVLLSFYFLVLFGPLVRFKIAFIFFLIAVRWPSLISLGANAAIAFGFHVSSGILFILFLPFFLERNLKVFREFSVFWVSFVSVFIGILLIPVIVGFIWEPLMVKLQYYSNFGGIIGALKVLCVTLLLWPSILKSRFEFLIIIGGAVFFGFFFGSNRVLMLFFLGALICGLRQDDFQRYFVLRIPIFLYFWAKGFDFIFSVVVDGTGFD